MVFSSVQFLFVFLPLALAVYYLLPRAARCFALAGFSILFFIWDSFRYTALLLCFAAVNWLGGLLLERSRNRRPLLTLLACADVGVLLVFKYLGFFAENVNALFPGLVPVFAPVLPLGLSFYTFTALGYLFDVAAGHAAAERDPVRFFVFLAFFGHGPSGPIVRWSHQGPQLSALPRFDAERFCGGIKRFILGLAKKAILADQLALIYRRTVAVPAAEMPGGLLVLGYTAFMLQLYFDFSGYTDMAVGLGMLFGLELPENFDYPYLSTSIGEFWRRWHITLGGWFRDYVYIPLGGSRAGLAVTCRNTLIVFALTGLWHGAAWHYVMFGLYHGLLLCIERLGLRQLLERLPRALCHLYTVTAVWVGMLIFGAPGMGEALDALLGILTLQKGTAGMTLAALADAKLLLLLALAALLCGPAQALIPPLKKWLNDRRAPGVPGMALLFGLLFLSIMRVTAGNYSAFIYAQF